MHVGTWIKKQLAKERPYGIFSIDALPVKRTRRRSQQQVQHGKSRHTSGERKQRPDVQIQINLTVSSHAQRCTINRECNRHTCLYKVCGQSRTHLTVSSMHRDVMEGVKAMHATAHQIRTSRQGRPPCRHPGLPSIYALYL